MTEVFNYCDWTIIDVESIKEPERYLKSTKDLLDGLRVDYYFAFGTALGLYRDNGFIKGDTDVDVAVITSDPWRVANEFRLHYKLIRKVEYNGVLQQVVFRGEDGFFIDICFFYIMNGLFTSYCEGGRWEDNPFEIGTPKEIDTKYGQFQVPEQIEAYLKTRYGDWRTPRYGAISQSLKA